MSLLASQAAAHLLFSLAQAAVLILTAFLVFRVTVKGNYGLLAFVVIVGTLCMLSVGYLLGSMPRDADSAAGVTMLVSFPMMFLGGSYFPTDGAPAFLQPLIQALPLTYLNHALTHGDDERWRLARHTAGSPGARRLDGRRATRRHAPAQVGLTSPPTAP